MSTDTTPNAVDHAAAIIEMVYAGHVKSEYAEAVIINAAESLDAARIAAEQRAERLRRYAAMLDAQSWRMSRGPLGREWATENQAREREEYGVADEFNFTGDLDPARRDRDADAGEGRA